MRAFKDYSCIWFSIPLNNNKRSEMLILERDSKCIMWTPAVIYGFFHCQPFESVVDTRIKIERFNFFLQRTLYLYAVHWRNFHCQRFGSATTTRGIIRTKYRYENNKVNIASRICFQRIFESRVIIAINFQHRLSIFSNETFSFSLTIQSIRLIVSEYHYGKT